MNMKLTMSICTRLFNCTGLIALAIDMAGCHSTAATPLTAAHRIHSADALWRITHEQCVPRQLAENTPAPCASVNLEDQYVIFKDRVGPLQYLLIPTEKINGIESTDLLNPSTSNFFAYAWQERRWLEMLYGHTIPVETLSLTVNAQRARTQNQLHIHISCLKPVVRSQLDSLAATLGPEWQPISNGMNARQYWARSLDLDELAHYSPFLLLANGLPQARDHMGEFGLGLASLQNGNLVLLASRQSGWLPHASMEEIQDHQCPQLFH